MEFDRQELYGISDKEYKIKIGEEVRKAVINSWNFYEIGATTILVIAKTDVSLLEDNYDKTRLLYKDDDGKKNLVQSIESLLRKKRKKLERLNHG